MNHKEAILIDASKNPGFRDVAEFAKVSITTVERVLNERGSVSPKTREKVLHAASQLGLRRVLPLPDYGNLRIEAILPTNPTPYWARLSNGFKNAAKLLPRGIMLHRTFVPENDPQAMIRAINASQLKRSALIVAAELDSEVAQSLAGVMEKGEILIFVSTRIPGLPAHAFSGVNNMAAGRLAASLINFALREKPAKVLILQANTTLQSHRDRVEGFRAELHTNHKSDVFVTHEAPNASWGHLAELAKYGRLPDAIYETADSGGEIAAILRKLDRKPIWIGHERNDAHEALIRERILDFVLDQDPEKQARWALKAALTELGVENSDFSYVEKPELRVFANANL